VHVPCPGVSRNQGDNDRLKAELAKVKAEAAFEKARKLQGGA
jgi:hypothetical protein